MVCILAINSSKVNDFQKKTQYFRNDLRGKRHGFDRRAQSGGNGANLILCVRDFGPLFTDFGLLYTNLGLFTRTAALRTKKRPRPCAGRRRKKGRTRENARAGRRLYTSESGSGISPCNNRMGHARRHPCSSDLQGRRTRAHPCPKTNCAADAGLGMTNSRRRTRARSCPEADRTGGAIRILGASGSRLRAHGDYASPTAPVTPR